MIRIILIIIAVVVLGSGQGLANDRMAVEDLIQAARQGDVRAMCDLGIIYYHGRGVLKDPFKAKCWIRLAHERGSLRAKKVWDRFELWQYPGTCDFTPVHSLPDFRPTHRPGDRYQDPVTGMAFVWVPGKCYSMGGELSGNGSDRGAPAKRVCLDGFWMGIYEVTQKQWLTLMDKNPSRFRGDDLPVEQVSFRDARNFIRRLNTASGLRYDLPREAQWEFACRNMGRKPAFPWGSEDFQPPANCGGCDAGSFRGRTAPVGSFLPNETGLYDMGGNVREWCRDLFDRDRKKERNRDVNGVRVVRGGSFVDPVSASRCRARQGYLPLMKTYFLGFRLVLESPEN